MFLFVSLLEDELKKGPPGSVLLRYDKNMRSTDTTRLILSYKFKTTFVHESLDITFKLIKDMKGQRVILRGDYQEVKYLKRYILPFLETLGFALNAACSNKNWLGMVFLFC